MSMTTGSIRYSPPPTTAGETPPHLPDYSRPDSQRLYQFRGGPRHGELIHLAADRGLVRVYDAMGVEFWYETAQTTVGCEVLVPTVMQVVL